MWFSETNHKVLGLSILTKGISMHQDEVETVRNCSWGLMTKHGRLNNLFHVQQFLGFCNYYPQFIAKYSEKAEPLTRLTK
jgi:hypothetical protein